MKKIVALSFLIQFFPGYADTQTTTPEQVTVQEQEVAILEQDLEQETAGQFLVFHLDEDILNLENLIIAAQKDQFYFVLKTEIEKIVILGKVQGQSMIVYNITIIQPEEQEAENSNIETIRYTFPLEAEVDIEGVQVHINEETRDLTLFFPFAQANKEEVTTA